MSGYGDGPGYNRFDACELYEESVREKLDLLRKKNLIETELIATKQLLKESTADNEKYRQALINLADYVLPECYKHEVLKLLGFFKDGLD